MATTHPICLLGFSDFECRTLAMQLALAGARTPGYALVNTPQEARFLVVDTDAKPAVQRAVEAGRLADALLVGSGPAPAGAMARLKRPLDARSLLRELDAAVWRTANPDGARAEPVLLAAPTHAATSTAAAAPAREPAFAQGSPTALASAATPPAGTVLVRASPRTDNDVGAPPSRAPDRGSAADVQDSRCDALLVDDSEIALHFLQTKLGELGLRSRTATDSDGALDQLSRHDFRYVFLDVELGQASRLDGLALCRHIKQMPHSGRGPVVALVSAHASQTDRVRGTLAGCDAYLGKPLTAHELMAVVSLRRTR